MKWLRLVPVFAVLALAGCKQKLHIERANDMDGGTSRVIFVDPPSGEQKIKVAFTSTAGPVSVLVVQEDQLTDKAEDLDQDKIPAAAVLGKEKGKDGTISATVPAKKAYRVIIFTDKKTSVTVKIDSV